MTRARFELSPPWHQCSVNAKPPDAIIEVQICNGKSASRLLSGVNGLHQQTGLRDTEQSRAVADLAGSRALPGIVLRNPAWDAP